MNTLRALIFIINTICILSLTDAAPTVKNERKIIIRGRVTFPAGSKTPIELDAKLTVELQDTSLADAPAIVIATGTSTAKRFPMAFTIRYSSSQVTSGKSYSLSVTIRNKNNELLYINDVHASVTPLGGSRTKFINVPVKRVEQTPTVLNKSEWPELVGGKGVDAVEIIKKETGFTNVEIIQEGSPVTMDYRTDRVRIIVNKNEIVITAPVIG